MKPTAASAGPAEGSGDRSSRDRTGLRVRMRHVSCRLQLPQRARSTFLAGLAALFSVGFRVVRLPSPKVPDSLDKPQLSAAAGLSAAERKAREAGGVLHHFGKRVRSNFHESVEWSAASMFKRVQTLGKGTYRGHETLPARPRPYIEVLQTLFLLFPAEHEKRRSAEEAFTILWFAWFPLSVLGLRLNRSSLDPRPPLGSVQLPQPRLGQSSRFRGAPIILCLVDFYLQ